jgi:hypothetical protein
MTTYESVVRETFIKRFDALEVGDLLAAERYLESLDVSM